MSDNTKPTKLIDIDKVFEEKNPGLKKYIPGFVTKYLKRITHQDQVNKFISDHHHITGIPYAEAIVNNFGTRYVIEGEENLSKEGRFIFAANHPLGGMDGMIFLAAVGKFYDNIKFPVNDILMNITNLGDIFLPINKHGSHSKEAVKQIDDAYASDSQILMFPAGMVSRRRNKMVRDLEWKKNFVRKAITHKRSIIPVHISGQNTNFFYNLSNLRKSVGIKANIEMLYLVDELYQQYNKVITITFGKPISPEELKNGQPAEEWAQKIKDMVYALEK